MPINYNVITGRRDADIRALAAISVLDNENPETLAEIVDYFRSELELMDPDSHLLIGAFAGHEITGFARFAFCERVGLWWCRGLVVAGEWQRRGIGAELLRQSLQQLRRRGACEARSDTGRGNIASQATHQRAGFVLHSTDDHDFDGQWRAGHRFYKWQS